jgi:hypothetical protein
MRREQHPQPAFFGLVPCYGYASVTRLNNVAMQGVNVIERAFQIAAESGSVDEVKTKLSREGYLNVHRHLGGKHTRSQILERLNPQLVVYRKRNWTKADGQESLPASGNEKATPVRHAP